MLFRTIFAQKREKSGFFSKGSLTSNIYFTCVDTSGQTEARDDGVAISWGGRKEKVRFANLIIYVMQSRVFIHFAQE